MRCEWPVEVEGDDAKGESWYKSLYRRLKELFLGAAPPRPSNTAEFVAGIPRTFFAVLADLTK